MRSLVVVVGLVGLAAGCTKSAPESVAASVQSAPSPAATTPAAAAPERAEVGKPAPDFALADLDGNEVKLSAFKGKTVVLEWFNPHCPFVRAAHTKGSLTSTPKNDIAKGVVWLAINSGAPGRQGHGVETNREGKKTYGIEYPILMDETGAVGKKYGATNTPHMFVIDQAGTLVYGGAIDNSPDGEGESAPGGKLVNYVDAALADVAAGRAVATASTKAYGCSVKYK
jgi:peroxiredoxin